MGLTSWNEIRGWRWMFGSGILPSVLFLLLLFFVPESPRWLAGKNREGEALAYPPPRGRPAARRRRTGRNPRRPRPGNRLVSVELFQPGMRMVLVIGVTLAVLQQVTGINVFLYFAPRSSRNWAAETDAALLQTVARRHRQPGLHRVRHLDRRSHRAASR